MPEMEIKREAGTPDQLPQGEAQALNESLVTAQQAAAPQPETVAQNTSSTPETPQDGPTPQEPGIEEVFRPSTDEEKFLFGPTERPDEMVELMPRIPPDIDEWLPYVRDAALAPDAPPALREFLVLVLGNIGD